MRIAYLLHFNINSKGGVFEKVLTQKKTWILEGHDARMFFLTRRLDLAKELGELHEDAAVTTYTSENALRSLLTRARSLRKLTREVRAWLPDLVYTRMDLYYPAVAALARDLPMVSEINSNDLAELAMYSRSQWAYHVLTRGMSLRGRAGLVFVTSELSEMRQYNRYCRPCEVISNGIDLYKSHILPSPVDNTTRLCFVGHKAYPWHGVDKIRSLAEACPDWEFDIIGCTRSDFPDLEHPNIKFHGVMARSDYESVLQNSDCAVGTLALHRKGMEEACPLKTREYLAAGLPTIIGYKDTDFPSGAEFLLQIGNTVDNVASHIEQIQLFVRAWKGRRISRDRIRHLDCSVKEGQRLAFFESLLSKTTSRKES